MTDLSLENLPLSVLAYLQAATPENSRRAYESDLRQFRAWGGAIPASEETLLRYLAEHAPHHKLATLTRRLASIAKAHRTERLANPVRSELLRACLRGIRRRHGHPQRRVAPIRLEDLEAMLMPLTGRLRDLRDRSVLLLGFAGAFRRAELVAIDCAELEWAPEGLVVTLPRGKTDQEGRGRQVAIPRGTGNFCPVTALEAWLSAAAIAQGPLYRAVDRHGRLGATSLNPKAVARIVKERAAAAGLDPGRYSGHSLRAGFTTSAAEAGLSVWAIKRQTGHRSDAMLARYIREGTRFFGIPSADSLQTQARDKPQRGKGQDRNRLELSSPGENP